MTVSLNIRCNLTCSRLYCLLPVARREDPDATKTRIISGKGGGLLKCSFIQYVKRNVRQLAENTKVLLLDFRGFLK